MSKRVLILCASSMLSSCFHFSEDAVVQGPSPRKQKLRIALLQKKLEVAEQERLQAQSEVARLSLEIEEAQLALIRRQVDKYEEKRESSPNLFLEEREALYRMIQAGSAPSSSEAQAELDRILRLITSLGNR